MPTNRKREDLEIEVVAHVREKDFICALRISKISGYGHYFNPHF